MSAKMRYTKAGYPTYEDYTNRTDGSIRYTLTGYAPEMVNLALSKDDPEAFIGFMKDCGFSEENISAARTLDGLNMEQYCRKRGAEKCLAAIAKSLGK